MVWYTSTSSLSSAATPATVIASKELTPICTKLLARANTECWSPAGNPILSMCMALLPLKNRLENFIPSCGVRRNTAFSTSTAETPWLRAVARATPDTPIPNATMNSISSATFMTPATIR